MPRTRTFLAIDMGDAVRSAASALQQTFARTAAGVNWVARDNLHITLLFLGEVDDRDLSTLCRTVSQCVRREPPFEIGVRGVGAFPNPRRPKTVWAGIADGAAELTRLHATLEGPLAETGLYRREDRPFTPHLTLGRVKSEADGQALAPLLAKQAGWVGGRAAVAEVVIYASDLRRDGPVYTVIGRAPLHGRGSGS